MNIASSRLNDLTNLNNRFFESVQQNSQKPNIFLCDFRKYSEEVTSIKSEDLLEIDAKIIQEAKEMVREIAAIINSLDIHEVLKCDLNMKSVLSEELAQPERCLSHPTVQKFLNAYHLVKKITAFSAFAFQNGIGLEKYSIFIPSSSKMDLQYLLNTVIDLAVKTESEDTLKAMKAFYRQYPFIGEEERLAAASEINEIHSRIDLYQLSRENRLTIIKKSNFNKNTFPGFLNNLHRYHFKRVKDIILICDSVSSVEDKIALLKKITQNDEKKRIRILKFCLKNIITNVPVFKAFHQECLLIDENIRYKYTIKRLEKPECKDVDGHLVFSLSEENRIRIAYKHHEKDFDGFNSNIAYYNITDEKIRQSFLDQSKQANGEYYCFFKISDPKKRYEHAYKYCTYEVRSLKHIKNYNITSEEDRFQLALAASEHTDQFFNDLDEFELTQEHNIVLIRMGAGKGLLRNVLKKIEIRDEELRLQIALENLLFYKWNRDFSYFKIHEPEKKKKLMEAIVQNHEHPLITFEQFNTGSFDIYPFVDAAIDQETFQMEDLKVIEKLNFSQEQLYCLFEKAITKLANSMTTFWFGEKFDLLTCGIQDAMQLKKLCRLSAGYPGFIHECLEQDFLKWTEEEIVEFLTKVIKVYPYNISALYRKIKIEDYGRRMQLAELSVQHNSECAATLFGIEEEKDVRKLIILQADAGHLKATKELFKYGVEDNEFLLEVLLKAKPCGSESDKFADNVLKQQFTHSQLKQITRHFLTNNLFHVEDRLKLLKQFREEEQFEIICGSISDHSTYKSITFKFSDFYKRQYIKNLIDSGNIATATEVILNLNEFDPILDGLLLKKCLIHTFVNYSDEAYEKKIISLETLMEVSIRKAGQKKMNFYSLSLFFNRIYDPSVEIEERRKFTVKLLLSQISISLKKFSETLFFLRSNIQLCFPDHQYLLELPRQIFHLSKNKTTKQKLFPDEILLPSLKALAANVDEIENPYLRKIQSKWFFRVLAASYLSPSFYRYTKYEKIQGILKELACLRSPGLKEYVTGVLIRSFFSGRNGCSIRRKALFSFLPTIHPNVYLTAVLLFAWLPKVAMDKLEFVIQAISKKRSFMKDVFKRKILLESLASIMKRTKLTKEGTVNVVSHIVSQSDLKKVLNDLNFMASIMNFEWEQSELDLNRLDQVVMNLVFKHAQFSEEEKEGLLERYKETFGRHHNPYAIMIYSAKHQQSEEKVRVVIGRFIKSILYKTISTDRYMLEGNIHLSRIFGSHPDKLVKWCTPMPFKGEDVVNLKDFFVFKGEISFKEFFIEKILQFKHLGDNQEDAYPQLIQGLLCTEEERKNIVAVLKERLKNESIKEMKVIAQLKLSCEILSLIDLTRKPNEACQCLDKIRNLVPRHLELYNDLNVFYDNMKNPIKVSLDELTFKICDDPSDLMQSGTDVGSCQRYEGERNYNKCLLAYLLDGKYQIAKVKNTLTGKILGRAMLRLLWDKENKTGVIHMEKVYFSIAEDLIKSAIKKMCIKFAEEVGFELVTSSQEIVKYPHILYSLDSPVPYEYVDGAGGIKSKAYEVRNTYYLS